MNALGFAWRSLVRQPARAALGILGVAAVGALLFDMLMLSRGLVVSMRDLLDRGGWDVRVSAGELPNTGGRFQDATATAEAVAALPSVRAALVVRLGQARIDRRQGPPLRASFQGVALYRGRSGGPLPDPPWTILRGRDTIAAGEIIVNEEAAAALGLAPGDAVDVRASCFGSSEVLPPVTLTIVGTAEFPFQSDGDTIGGRLETLRRACSREDDDADVMLVTSAGDAGATADAIRAVAPGLNAATNDDIVGRLQERGFTYFRQISTVLTTVTVSFAVLLITVLLTVSVNQRLGEVAALRALGFSRARVVKDVLSESVLIVGIGGLLSLPAGLVLASGLDRILTAMPGIPASLHFFVFQPRALAVHVALLAATAFVAALYPLQIVARLPIAATLREEVIG